jgi:hypothetical protein
MAEWSMAVVLKTTAPIAIRAVNRADFGDLAAFVPANVPAVRTDSIDHAHSRPGGVLVTASATVASVQ